jgi:anti-sigma28 factor (negative regulator of flagellin synthesis)
MIRGVGSQANIYQNNNNGSQKTKNEATSNEQKASRLEALKASIENGEYKVDLDALAEKMAKELS